jgi:hypothetical protein
MVKSRPNLAEAGCRAPRAPIDGPGSGGAFSCAGRRIHETEKTKMADYLPGPDADYGIGLADSACGFPTSLTCLSRFAVEDDRFAGRQRQPRRLLMGGGLVAADMTPLTTNQTLFNTGFAAHIAAKAAAQAAKQTKDESRAGLTAAISPLVRRLQASPAVSNAEREALGVTVRQEPGPIGPPTTAPHLQHHVRGPPPAHHPLRR